MNSHSIDKMDKGAQTLVLEMMDQVGAGYRPKYSTLEKEICLYEVVEKLIAHDSDTLVLRDPVGA